MNLEIEQTAPRIGRVPRPLYSTSNTNIHLDDGGSGNLQGLQRELPVINMHDFIVQVENGDFTGEGPAVHLGPALFKGEADFKIAGNVGNRELVTVDAGVNLSMYGKVEHIQIRGMVLDGLSQVDGMAWFRECHLIGNETCGLDGKGGWVQTHDTTLGSQRAEHAVYPNALQRLALRTSELRSSGTAIAGPIGSEVSLDRVSLGDDTDRVSRHHEKPRDGVYRGGRRLAYE
jgi:hypothetical protein